VEETEQLEVPIGTVLAGKYRVDRVLGAGGMGVVVEAHHLQLDQQVAIKMLLPSMLKHREAVERFTREARAAVKIKSEHVARVSDVGLLETGAPYMVMEYLEGEDLGHRVSEQGALVVPQAVEFLLQAAEAIAEAHALGIVHRDIKPANLFCVRRADGLLSVKVLDFGISKLTSGAGDLGMTKTQTVMGSPHYMAPEQVLSAKNADAQSDIWSLGAVLFELLTGRVPYEAETFPELVLKVSGTDAPPVDSIRTDVPPELSLVVARCLQRDRQFRFKNVAELAVALVPFGPERRAEASAERIIRVLESGAVPLSRASLTSALPALPAASRTPTLTATTKSGPGTPATNRTVAAFAHTSGEGGANGKKYVGFAAAAVLALAAGAWWFLSAPSTSGDATLTAPTAAGEPAPQAPPPVPAGPAQQEPVRAPPVQVEPVQVEPVQVEPAPASKVGTTPTTATVASTPPRATKSASTKKKATAAPSSKPAAATSPPTPTNSDPNSAFGGRL
jgi:serine/threonine protein kinase